MATLYRTTARVNPDFTGSVVEIGGGHGGEVAGAGDLAGDVAGDGDGREPVRQQRAGVIVIKLFTSVIYEFS
jgi:hypothetical protein